MIPSSSPITIHEDGKAMVGREWITAQDFEDDDDEHGRLPAMKGATPLTWPTLDA